MRTLQFKITCLLFMVASTMLFAQKVHYKGGYYNLVNQKIFHRGHNVYGKLTPGQRDTIYMTAEELYDQRGKLKPHYKKRRGTDKYKLPEGYWEKRAQEEAQARLAANTANAGATVAVAEGSVAQKTTSQNQSGKIVASSQQENSNNDEKSSGTVAQPEDASNIQEEELNKDRTEKSIEKETTSKEKAQLEKEKKAEEKKNEQQLNHKEKNAKRSEEKAQKEIEKAEHKVEKAERKLDNKTEKAQKQVKKEEAKLEKVARKKEEKVLDRKEKDIQHSKERAEKQAKKANKNSEKEAEKKASKTEKKAEKAVEKSERKLEKAEKRVKKERKETEKSIRKEEKKLDKKEKELEKTTKEIAEKQKAVTAANTYIAAQNVAEETKEKAFGTVYFKINKEKTVADEFGDIRLYFDLINNTSKELIILKPFNSPDNRIDFFYTKMECEDIPVSESDYISQPIKVKDEDYIVIAPNSQKEFFINGRFQEYLACSSNDIVLKINYNPFKMSEEGLQYEPSAQKEFNKAFKKITPIKIESENIKFILNKH